MSEISSTIQPLARKGHAAHCSRCLSALPNSQVEMDSSRLAVAFYCLGSLDLLDLINEKSSETERNTWRKWIWSQLARGRYGAGFRPSPYMISAGIPDKYLEHDTPHIVMTYTALLSLSILRDDFSELDRPEILKFLGECQEDDGSFSTVPKARDSDLRATYCAFAISSILDDWSGFDVTRALAYIASCRTYEGGYGQAPFCEAQGGTTYCALASLYLAPSNPYQALRLTSLERKKTIRWLASNQSTSGGFCGRTGKAADACYCFWCCASLQILGAKDLVNLSSLASFLSQCQFKYGGIAKAPGEHSDPYHTYLSLAALSLYSPGLQENIGSSWGLNLLDPLLNAKEETAFWARKYISGKSDGIVA